MDIFYITVKLGLVEELADFLYSYIRLLYAVKEKEGEEKQNES